MSPHRGLHAETPARFPALDAADIEAIVTGRHGDPFSVLGMHRETETQASVRVFRPDVDRIEIVDVKSGAASGDLEKIHSAGLFCGSVHASLRYKLRLHKGGQSWDEHDSFRFPPVLSELDLHLIAEGRHWRLYEWLGCHPLVVDGVSGAAFAVWAPNAHRVSVVADFNDWDGRRHPMRKRHEAGVWEIFIPDVAQGPAYKFEILDRQGELLPLKADPLSFSQEAPPSTASHVHGLPSYDWRDSQWIADRSRRQSRNAPIAIYEVHLGSWRRGKDGAYFGYDRLADELIPYVKDLGFTHIELLPISEHPFSGSWGYQPIGLFSPTARFGPPNGFAQFVNRCHQAGLGVVLDWVPAHFPSDPHGLVRFDGTALYEHEDPRLGVHKDWNTLIYNFGRREVASFLQSNALFWLDRYHVDGLRVDAVASMLYLDYSRQPGEWLPNKHGGRENLDAIAFLREMNTRAYGQHPGAMTIAEESTAWPNVSRPVEMGGLGFGYKWNMGWMHDTLDYMSHEPIYRRFHHDKLTFGLLYAFHENFVLPLSHDEVVHGKGSLLGRMPGDRWQKFANLRAYLAFMWAHPGKKLLFMGGEIAQEREWDHDSSLDWNLLGDGMHRGVQDLVRDLNRLYRTAPALHELDCEPEGFEWIEASNAEESIIAFLRKGAHAGNPIIVACNFTPVVRTGVRVGAPFGGLWRESVNTDSAFYGGSNVGNGGGVVASDVPCHGRPFSIELTLPPLATLIFEHKP